MTHIKALYSAVLASLIALPFSTSAAPTKLADQPLSWGGKGVAGANVILTPSVEWPTALGVAHKDSDFVPTTEYIGYFDPAKCYTYSGTYFEPKAIASLVSGRRVCNGQMWSGNLLNYATMGTIDIFRWVMTGGSRWVDPDASPAVDYDRPYDSSKTDASLVVLRRAHSNGQGNDATFPVRRIQGNVAGGISSYMPAITGINRSNTVGLDSLDRGMTFAVANTTTANHSSFPTPAAIFNAAVEVCNATIGLEGNCTTYKSTLSNGTVRIAYKPEGLMQQYRDRFRFAVFGYLNRQFASGNSGPDLDGAALRAPMKDISSELTDMGAFIRNPDSALATATSVAGGSTVQDSGAMNYLNKFGFRSRSYKSHDPVGEMYAEAIRYFTGANGSSPTTIPVATPTIAELDYFPMITNWTQYPAIKNWCDRNFVIGIGDVNTHADKNIATTDNPKAAIEDGRGVITVTDPNGAAVNVRDWTAKIFSSGLEPSSMAGWEGRQTIGGVESGANAGYNFVSNSWVNSVGRCCNQNGFFMAGLAYWANTNDVSKLAGPSPDNQVQTVQTYWVDVMENLIFKNYNQYYLATKYGGFTDANVSKGVPPYNPANSRPDVQAEWSSKCRTVASGGACLPDNYYPASDAGKMRDGLAAIFQNAAGSLTAGTGITGGTSNFPKSAVVTAYQTKFDPNDWTGDVAPISAQGFDSSGNLIVTTTPAPWSAKTVITNQFAGTNWNSRRRIVTMGLDAIVGGVETFKPAPFRIGALSPTQLATLGSTTTEQQSVLNYLRGDRTGETPVPPAVAAPFRERKALLGDIVDSAAVYVGEPGAIYGVDNYNPGYGTFKSGASSPAAGRAANPMLVVGANDGMLHVLDAKTGEELFAYVPSAVYEGPTTEVSGSETDGIAALANPSYAHRFYVNATPVVRDVDFNRAGDENWKSATSSEWHTIAVGGLGKGGKLIYALDLTAPVTSSESESSMTSGANYAKRLLWEFTDPDLGFSYGEPLVIKTERWGWVVVVSGGYNNGSGLGRIFVLHPKTGALLASASTGVGTAANPSGLSELTGFTKNYNDFTFKEIYGGDLLGNVWRFDLPQHKSVSASAAITVVRLATLMDSAGDPQPITMPPWVDIANDAQRYVFVGTGKALHNDDMSLASKPNTQTQSMYALHDGDQERPYSAANQPAGKNLPYARGDLTQVTDVLVGVPSKQPYGWYYDFITPAQTPTPAVAATTRMIHYIRGNSAQIAWLVDLPTTDPCEPGFKSWAYWVDMATGQTVLVDSAGAPLRTVGGNSSYVSLNIVRTGNSVVLIGTDSSGNTKIIGQQRTPTTPRIVNWRTIGE